METVGIMQLHLLILLHLVCLFIQLKRSLLYCSPLQDVLFPYALKNVEEYLKTHWKEDATKTVVAALREQADEDKKAEVEGVVTIPAEVSCSSYYDVDCVRH